MTRGELSIVAASIAIASLGGWAVFSSGDTSVADHIAARSSLPDVNPARREGQLLYVKRCAVCHGDRAKGTVHGPALARGQISLDATLPLASPEGLREKHAQYGDMAPIEDLSSEQAAQIAVFVQSIDRQSGG